MPCCSLLCLNAGKLTDQEILERLSQDQDIRAILEMIRSLELKDSWLAAGSIRNFIWNILSGKSGFDAETDVDVIFFDPTVSYEKTLQLEMYQFIRKRRVKAFTARPSRRTPPSFQCPKRTIWLMYSSARLIPPV